MMGFVLIVVLEKGRVMCFSAARIWSIVPTVMNLKMNT